MKAMLAPSGAQRIDLLTDCSFVMRRGSPPEAETVQTSECPPRPERKAIRPPSGDHCGEFSEPLPGTSILASPPLADITQIFEAPVRLETNAIQRLSGENSTSPIR